MCIRDSAERGWEHRSVLSGTDGLEALDRLASPEPVQDGAHLPGSVLGTQELDGFADGLLVGVAEQPLGGPVPARDGTGERGADDRFAAELNYCRHPVALAASLFRLTAGGQVAHRRDHQLAIPGADVGQADIDLELAAIPSPSGQLQTGSQVPSLRVYEVSRPVGSVGRPERLRHQRLNGQADEGSPGIAEQRFSMTIDELD